MRKRCSGWEGNAGVALPSARGAEREGHIKYFGPGGVSGWILRNVATPAGDPQGATGASQTRSGRHDVARNAAATSLALGAKPEHCRAH